MLPTMIKNRCKLGPPKPGAKRLIFGDIHGQYSSVMTLLETSAFDPAKDAIICVGDLIDRGPDSLQCARLLTLPYVSSCVGNHELMAIEANISASAQLIKLWRGNGGNWFYTLTPSQQNEVLNLFLSRLFWTIEFNWQQFVIGVVHAEIPALANWRDFDNGFPIAAPMQKYLVWSRQRILNQTTTNVLGVDFTIAGHTITDNLLRLGNTLSIDTGAALMSNNDENQGKLSMLEFSDQVILRSVSAKGRIETRKVSMP